MTKPVTWSVTAAEALKRLDGRLFATVTEAAAVLHYDHRTVRAACTAGDVPAIRVGSTWRIPTAWLREQAQPAAEVRPARAEGAGPVVS